MPSSLPRSGELTLSAIRASAPATSASLAAGALLTVGFGVKVAIVPLHTWLPDAHGEAPSGISALLSGVVIEAGLVALLRTLMALAGIASSWGTLLMAFGAVNMLAGNLLALRQTQVKRLLAFSSVSHIGYMLLGLGIAFYTGEAAGAQGGFFHLITHGMMKGLAFLAAGALLLRHRARAPGWGRCTWPDRRRLGRCGAPLPAGGAGAEPGAAGLGRAAAAGRLSCRNGRS